ncbi:MAG: hypothetical protein K0S41_1102 [Anaerocolumna sp.]|nr:hypothetical protein [Anaerocolumna sp.]
MFDENVEKLQIDKPIANDILSGNIDSLKQYIKSGWDINQPLLIDEDGYQYRSILPIMFAIYKCNV